jgi:hypothetical protein
MEPSPKSDKGTWTIPSRAQVMTALQYFWQKRVPVPKITLVFKLDRPTVRKTRLLLEAHVFVTNLTATIFKGWREKPDTPRQDKAVAKVLALQTGKPVFNRPRTLATEIEATFEPEVAETKLRFADTLCQGAYRDAAQTLIGWVQKLSLRIDTERAGTFSLDDFYTEWQRLETAYRQAMAVIATLAFHPDQHLRPHELERKSKREARWMLLHLKSEQELSRLIDRFEALLDDEPSSLQREALFDEVSFPRKSGKGRRVREHWFLQRFFEAPKQPLLLGQLDHNVLETCLNELYEMVDHLSQIRGIIDTIFGIETYAEETNDAAFRAVLETFLAAKPDSYPRADFVRLAYKGKKPYVYAVSEEEIASQRGIEDAEELYKRRASWFQVRFDKKDDLARFLDTKRESEEVQGMFRALRRLRPPRLKPIRFNGTARPHHFAKGSMHSAQNRYFALLFEPATFDLTLAIFLHPARAKYYTDEEQKELNKRAADQKRYQQRRAAAPLYYVNFPETPFSPPQNSSVLLYPLKYGRDYHMQQYIDRIVTQQWANQFIAYKQVNEISETSISMTECLPEVSPICSGRITCSLNARHDPEFYFHAHMDVYPPEKQGLPIHVLGVCAYDGIYAYAVLDLDGRVIHVDDIHVPRHVDSGRGAKPHSKNFIYEMANVIVSKAWHWHAYVGIEDTALKKNRAAVSRAVNQILFGIPTQRIAQVVSQKMLHEGMMEPRLINGISRLDCSHCKTRVKQSRQKHINVLWTAECPECHHRQFVDIDLPNVFCTGCGCEWKIDEGMLVVDDYLSCPLCYASPMLVRQSMAIVVAQKTLVAVVRHHGNLLAKLEQLAQEQLLERAQGGL